MKTWPITYLVAIVVAGAVLFWLVSFPDHDLGRPERDAHSNDTAHKQSVYLHSVASYSLGDTPTEPGAENLAITTEPQSLTDIFAHGISIELRLQCIEDLLRKGEKAVLEDLLTYIEQLPDGDEKEGLGQLVAGIRNPQVSDVLLNWITQTNDPSGFRAAAIALNHIADDEVVRSIEDQYDFTTNDEIRQRLVDIVSGIKSEAAIIGLISLADGKDRNSDNPIIVAAVEGLGQVGTPHAVNYLLQRLENAPDELAAMIEQSLSQIFTPEARASLCYAAQGNKEASSDKVRVAAIRALRNHGDEETISVLTTLTADLSPLVKAAAEEALDSDAQDGKAKQD